MKTPSLLPLLLLAVALPSRAGLVAPARCDVEFLEKVAKDYTGPGSIPDPDKHIGTASRTVNRANVTTGVLSLSDANLCDAGTRRHLAAGSPLVWRNAKAQEVWDGNDAKVHAGLLLVVVDSYKTIDPKVAEVIAAADGVLAAGFAIGVAEPVDQFKANVDFFKANSGGEFLASATKDWGVLAPNVISPIKPTTGVKIIPHAHNENRALAEIIPGGIGHEMTLQE